MERSRVYYCQHGVQYLVTVTVLLLTLVTSSARGQTKDPNGCNITWVTNDGAVALNGGHLDNSTYKDVAACQQYCIITPGCTAVEWDRGAGTNYGCWYHIGPAGDLYDGATSTNYQIVRACPPGLVTSTVATTTPTTTTSTTTTPTTTLKSNSTATSTLATTTKLNQNVGINGTGSNDTWTNGSWTGSSTTIRTGVVQNTAGWRLQYCDIANILVAALVTSSIWRSLIG